MSRVRLLPTATGWALGARASDPDAWEEVFRIKQRPRDKSLLLLVPEVGMALHYAAPGVRARLARAAEATWPGSLTWVVDCAPETPAWLRGEGNTVALRLDPDPQLRTFLEEDGEAWSGTSANRSGEPPLEDPADILAALGEDLPVVGSGPRPCAIPSSMVLLPASGPPRVLREGAVSPAAWAGL